MTDAAPPENAELWTVRRVLAWASEDFQKRGSESPRLDAELLLAHVLDVDRVRLIVDSARPLAEQELSHYRELIKRRRRGEPVAYVLGEREFFGLSFRVDSRVLIPRPDTETLVGVALARTLEAALSGNALDLCTGSGCVGIAFARERPTWRVTLSDIEPGAADLARENALRLSALNATRVLVGDRFSALGANERFHLITANPPYIPRHEINELQVEIKDFEPHRALSGGDDGLELVRPIISEARHYLEPGGVLALELAFDQAPRVEALFSAAGYVQVERARDYGGHERVVSGRWPSEAHNSSIRY